MHDSSSPCQPLNSLINNYSLRAVIELCRLLRKNRGVLPEQARLRKEEASRGTTDFGPLKKIETEEAR
jgi:hypothetical protein